MGGSTCAARMGASWRGFSTGGSSDHWLFVLALVLRRLFLRSGAKAGLAGTAFLGMGKSSFFYN